MFPDGVSFLGRQEAAFTYAQGCICASTCIWQIHIISLAQPHSEFHANVLTNSSSCRLLSIQHIRIFPVHSANAVYNSDGWMDGWSDGRMGWRTGRTEDGRIRLASIVIFTRPVSGTHVCSTRWRQTSATADPRKQDMRTLHSKNCSRTAKRGKRQDAEAEQTHLN